MPKWFDDLVPAHLRDREEEIQTLAQRKQTRYWLFRLKTEADGEAKATGLPRGFRGHFKKQEWFDGWENFGVTWDVEADDPLTTYPRYQSIHEEWDEVLNAGHRSDEIAARQRHRQKQREPNGSEGHV